MRDRRLIRARGPLVRVALPDGPREGRPCEPAVTALKGADAYGRMAAWLGRRPLSPTA
ncbi:hypothetical protein ACSCB1_14305 [Streptomyces europaeiscabiei]|uniref:hypothetical protein n=1 Tax=Streptomyces europaeiscabiei TaxID=146819 RepID=UPI00131E639D|nr:hypothetical protein [Streptomyces europaeiscabiei]MDX2528857.1 hypothetical protein [Streptomyces europaeiscabiei]MDX2760686.1 hypothetical protein [Streptomyces europaeiscabiei]MDX2770829.1 hypothetical protein [Streptomyces europaeiscabiei]MDX3713078.1 hypothetical protein [Streptomyces europaeiscabiei]MDX3780056.1 hypothetical protein [Streptomyces europaeiscabiei]